MFDGKRSAVRISRVDDRSHRQPALREKASRTRVPTHRTHHRELRCDPRPNMTDEELGFEDAGDDGESWGHMSPVAHPELEHLFVHHAAYRACSEDFSLQDLLRMNDFWIEIHITHQHIVDQEGCKCGWWQDCTFEEFRCKIESEADHRPKGWSRGQFISKRCRQAILEDEDFSSENDPLYDDGKIDEFLSDVFAELHRPHENPAKSNR